MRVTLLLGIELLDRSEYHATRYDRKLTAQIGAALRLHRWLAKQVLATRKGTKELVVKVVAIGQDDDGRVLHRQLARDRASVEGHCQALARTLCVPDDTDAAVAKAAGLIGPSLLTDVRIRTQPGRSQRLGDRSTHGVELVVTSHLLHKHATAIVLEDNEVAQQREQPLRCADLCQQYTQLRYGASLEAFIRDHTPRLEPLLARGEGAKARFGAIRDDE